MEMEFLIWKIVFLELCFLLLCFTPLLEVVLDCLYQLSIGKVNLLSIATSRVYEEKSEVLNVLVV